jgi:sialic acid synthase SpsE
MKLLVLNGPNLSRLDIRDSAIYGDLNYAELKSMIDGVNNVYKSLGSENRIVSNDELAQRLKMRRSLIVNQDVNIGEILTELNLAAKRPGTGICVSEYDSILGKKLMKSIKKDSLLSTKDFLD